MAAILSSGVGEGVLEGGICSRGPRDENRGEGKHSSSTLFKFTRYVFIYDIKTHSAHSPFCVFYAKVESVLQFAVFGPQ